MALDARDRGVDDPAVGRIGCGIRPRRASGPLGPCRIAPRMAVRSSSDRDTSRNYRLLLPLARFALPYRWQIAGATVALIVTAGTTLALGIGLRVLVDQGFSAGDAALLDRAV